jgi:hypothetical protein
LAVTGAVSRPLATASIATAMLAAILQIPQRVGTHPGPETPA